MNTSTDTLFDRVLHGGDYNPEQWPEQTWDEDVSLMQQAGWNIATLPVFGWVNLQPDESTWSFDWLDTVLGKLHGGGIGACLATATASVPAWLAQKYPDVLVVGRDGGRRKHGNRHTFCPNSPNFRRLSTGLARQMAQRYKDHPALRLWHVGNEYGTHCYCPQCEEAFRGWLRERYGSLEELNRRWYTAFWGHTYTDWSQVESPSQNGEKSIQALSIDYDRFQSHSLLNCYRAEAQVLREATPGVPVTTNMMGPFKPLDYHDWAREVDVVSWDCYPAKGATPAQIAFSHSLMRGLKEGKPWLLMEQTPSQQNWQQQNALKRPGVMRLWSYQAMAHGSDAVMYFQWRRGQGGIEKFHGAVVEHVGTGETRVFQEVAKLGRELEALGTQTLGGRVEAEVALLFDWENWWAIEYSSGPSVDLKYVQQCQAYFSALHEAGIACDIVSPEADLSRYKVLVAPVLYMVKEGVAEKLEAWVKAGGTFVTTFFSGIADETDLVHLGGYPGPLRPMLGIWAEEIDALRPQDRNRAVFSEPFGALQGAYECSLLCDRVHLEGAQALAVYGDDFYAGEPAVTLNRFGEGHALYAATALEARALRSLMAEVCDRAGVRPLVEGVPEGVEIMARNSDAGRLLYVLNHNAAAASVALPAGKYLDLLSGHEREGTLELEGYGVAILRSA